MKGNTSKKHIVMAVISSLLLIAGVGLVAYPLVSDALNTLHGRILSDRYQEEAAETYELAKRQAKIHAGYEDIVMGDPFSEEYLESVRDGEIGGEPFKEHTIGMLYLPSIGTELPIFDRGEEIFMSKGATWLSGTSFPGLGEGHNTVLTSHRGLPSAKLFTDLPNLADGDIFILYVGGEYLAYEVYTRHTVTPDDLAYIKDIPNKDTTSLLTCTPYGINSHRIIITGERVPFTPTLYDELSAIRGEQNTEMSLVLILIVGTVFLAVLLIARAVALGRKREARLTLSFIARKSGETYLLFTGNGKEQIVRKAEGDLEETPVTTISDDTGYVEFTNLPAMNFTVKRNGTKTNEHAKFKPVKRGRQFEFAMVKNFGVVAEKGRGKENAK